MGKGRKEVEITHSAGEIGREGKSVEGMMMMMHGNKKGILSLICGVDKVF